jgi:hypothetical protein
MRRCLRRPRIARSTGLPGCQSSPDRDVKIQQIPQDAVEKRGLVGAGQVKDHPVGGGAQEIIQVIPWSTLASA